MGFGHRERANGFQGSCGHTLAQLLMTSAQAGVSLWPPGDRGSAPVPLRPHIHRDSK